MKFISLSSFQFCYLVCWFISILTLFISSVRVTKMKVLFQCNQRNQFQVPMPGFVCISVFSQRFCCCCFCFFFPFVSYLLHYKTFSQWNTRKIINVKRIPLWFMDDVEKAIFKWKWGTHWKNNSHIFIFINSISFARADLKFFPFVIFT